MLAGGQLNRALRVNGEYVLRHRDAQIATGSLRREALLLRRLAGRLPVAEVVADGLEDLLGEYLVTRWLPGANMLAAWQEHPDVQTREWWIEQWVQALRVLHEERYALPGEFQNGELVEARSWRTYVENRICKRLDRLMRTPGADRELVLAAERWARRQSRVLEDGPFCLIHRDLHFGNVLVDGPHLRAILDFELAEVGPPDYELDAIFRFLQSPASFAAGPGARWLTPGRFASVWFRLKKGYPELIAVPRLRERLALYALDHSLSRLLQSYHAGVTTTNTFAASLSPLKGILSKSRGEALDSRRKKHYSSPGET
jgi:aminoglycoside phosphotransferase (APT) family kinase protein